MGVWFAPTRMLSDPLWRTLVHMRQQNTQTHSKMDAQKILEDTTPLQLGMLLKIISIAKSNIVTFYSTKEKLSRVSGRVGAPPFFKLPCYLEQWRTDAGSVMDPLLGLTLLVFQVRDFMIILFSYNPIVAYCVSSVSLVQFPVNFKYPFSHQQQLLHTQLSTEEEYLFE